MLHENVFKSGLKSLVTEFENRGFVITQERAAQWYEHMKNMSEKEFNQRIEYVLKNCSFSPSMADILKIDMGTSKNLTYATDKEAMELYE